VLKEYRNDELIGLPGVVLMDAVEEERCIQCGHVAALTIPKMADMLVAAAVLRATMPEKLVGTEIRGLRRILGLSAKKLAQQLGVREESISRWDNKRAPIGLGNEKLLRMMVVVVRGDQAPGIEADPHAIVSMDILCPSTRNGLPSPSASGQCVSTAKA